jgi:hypothetical protein
MVFYLTARIYEMGGDFVADKKYRAARGRRISSHAVHGTPYTYYIRGQLLRLKIGWSGHLVVRKKLAEREGFEPSEEVSPLTRLAGEHLRPLGHLSVRAY